VLRPGPSHPDRFATNVVVQQRGHGSGKETTLALKDLAWPEFVGDSRLSKIHHLPSEELLVWP
jgi:hypothetical protein